ncbi:hypothetical protein [Vibrio mediterranei]|uniref:hypothetical protein n=1 Tax=Vibrio mediterranei TaxID=689 RepID=UPI0040699105
MKTLPPAWLAHPWADTTQKVVEIPIEILALMSNVEAKDCTDGLDGVVRHQEEVFDSIEKDGMRDPLLVVISMKYGGLQCRLEAGNHRWRVAKARGYTHLPVATLVITETYLNKGNGLHSFNGRGLIDDQRLLKQPYPYQVNLLNVLTKEALAFDESYWRQCLNR